MSKERTHWLDLLKQKGMKQIWLAAELGVTPSYLSQCKNQKDAPIMWCVRIERLTNGQVTRRDLRPDDWYEIWPELAVVGLISQPEIIGACK